MNTCSLEPGESSSPLTFFPKRIRDAITFATTGREHGLDQLTRHGRQLLAWLLRFVDKIHPESVIRVTNQHLAEGLGVCARTIGNYKRQLERAGFISRQSHFSRTCGPSVSSLWLTPKALRALGLVIHSKREKIAYSNPTVLLEQVTADTRSKPVEKIKRKKTGKIALVPADLTLLRDGCGLSLPAIWRLMGVASCRGKRLGDVLEAHGDFILSAEDPYGATKACIKGFEGKGRPKSKERLVDEPAVIASEGPRLQAPVTADQELRKLLSDRLMDGQPWLGCSSRLAYRWRYGQLQAAPREKAYDEFAWQTTVEYRRAWSAIGYEPSSTHSPSSRPAPTGLTVQSALLAVRNSLLGTTFPDLALD